MMKVFIRKILYKNINLNYLATGLNFTLSISFSISPVDLFTLNRIFLRSSILWSCKLALLAIWGVVGGNNRSGSGGGGGGGGGSGTDKDFRLSSPLDKDATDASIRQTWIFKSFRIFLSITKYTCYIHLDNLLFFTIVEICSLSSCNSCSNESNRTSDPKLIGSNRSDLLSKKLLVLQTQF